MIIGATAKKKVKKHARKVKHAARKVKNKVYKKKWGASNYER